MPTTQEHEVHWDELCYDHNLSDLSYRVMHALFWIAAAILISLFFPAVGAFMLNPFGAILIAVLIIGIAGGVAEDE